MELSEEERSRGLSFRRKVGWGDVASLAALCVVFVAGILFAGLSSGHPHVVAVTFTVVTCAVFVGIVATLESVAIREIRRPLPLFRLDVKGVECARGRYEWHDVDKVVEVCGRSKRVLRFLLRPGAEARPASYLYSDRAGIGGLLVGSAKLKLSSRMRPPGLYITMRWQGGGAIEAVKRLYGGPVASIGSGDLYPGEYLGP